MQERLSGRIESVKFAEKTLRFSERVAKQKGRAIFARVGIPPSSYQLLTAPSSAAVERRKTLRTGSEKQDLAFVGHFDGAHVDELGVVRQALDRHHDLTAHGSPRVRAQARIGKQLL